MNRLVRPSSLRQRLTWWLALQSFAGLGLVCLAVYVVTEANFHERQDETLAQKEAVVRHMLTDGKEHKNLDNLSHGLSDFLVGHGDLSLQVEDPSGAVLFSDTRNQNKRTVLRHRLFDVGQVAGPDTKVMRVQLSLDIQADNLLLYRLRLTLFFAAVGGAVIITLGGVFLVKLGLAPVDHLAEQTRSLSVHNLHHRLDGIGQPLELVPLVEQFNSLLSRIEKAYTQMEGFNADVSHELCTPLATLTTSNELALRNSKDADTRDVLASNLEELQRMTGIVNDMLFLSQADRGVSARRAYIGSLAQVASDVLDYHEAALAEAEVTAVIRGDATGTFDGPLLRRAVSNLLGNATRYATRGSEVRICIDPQTDGRVAISVENQGAPVDPIDLPHFFDRFFRGDRSRTHAQTNHGLGLAIVGAIARMHAGKPFATSKNGMTRVGIDVTSR